jgi:hypothetical protein
MSFKKVGLVLIILLVYSCSSSSIKPGKTVLDAPNWVSRQPIDDSFWYGVGVADLNLDDPRQVARQRAFSEIAEQLKVNIKSTLSDEVIARNQNFSEFSKSLIETRVDASLEYVENFDSFQGGSRQYVLARLNKSKYFEKINRKKEEAASKAVNLIDKSVSEMSANSLSNVSLAIETITPYLDLFPKMNDIFEKKEEELIIIVAEKIIRNYNENIRLVFNPKSIKAMSFVSENLSVGITALNKKTGKNISNVRIIVSIDGDDNNNDFIITDRNGKAKYELSRLKSNAGNKALIFSLDYKSMMSEKALSLIKVIPKEYPLEVNVKAPKIYVDESVINLGNKVNNSSILTTIKECFEDNYSSTFVNNKRNADMLLSLKIATEERSKRLGDNYPFFVYASGTLGLTSLKTNEIILNSKFKDAKGADFSSKEVAGVKALKKLSSNMNIDICE